MRVKRSTKRLLYVLDIADNWPDTATDFDVPDHPSLQEAVGTLWDLGDVISEAEYIDEYQDYFALGVEKKTRKRTLANLKRELKTWKKKRNKLKRHLKKCAETRKKKPCSKAKQFTVDVDNMRAQLPERYTADCKNIALEMSDNYQPTEWSSGKSKELIYITDKGRTQSQETKRLNRLLRHRLRMGCIRSVGLRSARR